MSNNGKAKNGNALATWSAIFGIGGAAFSVAVIGLPLAIIAIVLARKAFKVGNFGEYTDSDNDTMSYSFRARVGLVSGIIGCVIGFGSLFLGAIAGILGDF